MIIATLVLITSKAKYKNIETMDLVNGIINYTPADIDLVAIQIENDNGEYEVTDTIPSSGYILSDTSYCNVNGEKDTSIKLTYANGLIGISDITKKVKCYLYFNKKVSALDIIIGDTTNIEEKIEFTGITTSTDTGIYSAPDDYGTSYYFRGVEDKLNNWVKFAGFYWRIIRINGNGTVRMIYSGVASGNPSTANKIGTTTQIGGIGYKYNSVSSDNTYVGYMKTLNDSGSTTSSNGHENNYDSNAKAEIDSWYQNNIENNAEYAKYLDKNTGFCNDRQIDKTISISYTGNGYGGEATGYAPWGRLGQNSTWKTIQTPTLKCGNKSRDLFTTNTNDVGNIGNKALKYPVGIITSDEVVFAGGFAGLSNQSYYLYTKQDYWTMSPSYPSYLNGGAYVFYVYSNGNIWRSNDVHNLRNGLRPIINLRADASFSYNNESTKGSETDPFIVV